MVEDTLREALYDPHFDPENSGELEEITAQPRDSFVGQAKSDLKKLFEQESESVFYQRQLQVMVEKQYFHWITVRYQLYPFGQKAFADEVRARLRLPTDSPTRIEDGTVKRLLDWHMRKLRKAG